MNILNWNAVTLEANRFSHSNGRNEQTGPPLSARALAIVHLAMHDTYAAMVNAPDWPTYLPLIPGAPTNTSTHRRLALAGAAFTALRNLFPSQLAYLEGRFTALNGNRATPSHQYGERVAQAILQDRQFDPGSDMGLYTPTVARNAHRVDPDNPTQGYHAPYYGAASRGFAITERHELAPPPNDNPVYQAALKQVRYKGIKPELTGTLPNSGNVTPNALNMTQRTPDETTIGIYWGYDGSNGLGTPPRLYNQIIRKIAMARGNTDEENAQLFTLVNVAMADAAILAWDQKYIHEFCRPVVGIRTYDPSSDPDSSTASNPLSNLADPFWLPLGAPKSNSFSPTVISKNFTPNFPAYPSGHATFGAAAFQMTRLFYGSADGGVDLPPTAGAGNTTTPDTLLATLIDPEDPTGPIFFVSDEMNNSTQSNQGDVRPLHRRHFDSLWQMIMENGFSRVTLGVHWIFDAHNIDASDPNTPVFSNVPAERIGGVPLGLTVAEDIFRNRNGRGIVRSTVSPRT